MQQRCQTYDVIYTPSWLKWNSDILDINHYLTFFRHVLALTVPPPLPLPLPIPLHLMYEKETVRDQHRSACYKSVWSLSISMVAKSTSFWSHGYQSGSDKFKFLLILITHFSDWSKFDCCYWIQSHHLYTESFNHLERTFRRNPFSWRNKLITEKNNWKRS